MQPFVYYVPHQINPYFGLDYQSNYTNNPISYRNPTYNYPEINIQKLKQSAQAFKELLREGEILQKKLETSPSFAKNLMTAAQESNTNKVKQLLKGIGLRSLVETAFNPDGIKIRLVSKVDGIDCCHLTLDLRW